MNASPTALAAAVKRCYFFSALFASIFLSSVQNQSASAAELQVPLPQASFFLLECVD